MTITLLTAVPRTGKTSYAVWDIIKPAIEEGKIVYVCGIPKLQLPHIKVDHAWIRKWHERKYSENLEEDQLEHRFCRIKRKNAYFG
ncbi:zonular occludens toxin domain-containing protein [Nitrosomonas sp.]|uniref:zonular occludens toxin domain-containing protein n=1 Tax=Nitrosomonas sp. TaxID=42353 RepID=UPI00374CAA7F